MSECEIRISIGDTGKGIDREDLNRVFDPFFSTKGVWGKDAVVGTGMGLSICRNVAREHGGDILVESVPGIGTTFTFTLPIAEPVRLPGESTDGFAGLSILLFALDEDLIAAYQPQAEEQGHRMTVAAGLRDLPRQLRPSYDLVIADSHYPGKIELLRLLQDSTTYQVPFVLVNCSGMHYQLADTLDQALASYHSVPTLREIVSRVGGPSSLSRSLRT